MLISHNYLPAEVQEIQVSPNSHAMSTSTRSQHIHPISMAPYRDESAKYDSSSAVIPIRHSLKDLEIPTSTVNSDPSTKFWLPARNYRAATHHTYQHRRRRCIHYRSWWIVLAELWPWRYTLIGIPLLILALHLTQWVFSQYQTHPDDYGRDIVSINRLDIPTNPASTAEDWLEKYSKDVHAMEMTDRPRAAIISLVRNEELDGIVQSMVQLEYRWNNKYQYPWIFFNDIGFSDHFKVCSRPR